MIISKDIDVYIIDILFDLKYYKTLFKLQYTNSFFYHYIRDIRIRKLFFLKKYLDNKIKRNYIYDKDKEIAITNQHINILENNNIDYICKNCVSSRNVVKHEDIKERTYGGDFDYYIKVFRVSWMLGGRGDILSNFIIKGKNITKVELSMYRQLVAHNYYTKANLISFTPLQNGLFMCISDSQTTMLTIYADEIESVYSTQYRIFDSKMVDVIRTILPQNPNFIDKSHEIIDTEYVCIKSELNYTEFSTFFGKYSFNKLIANNSDWTWNQKLLNNWIDDNNGNLIFYNKGKSKFVNERFCV